MARIAFLVDEMFEESEFRVPYDRVRRGKHEAVIVGLEVGKRLVGKNGKETITTEEGVEDVSVDDFDAIVIPGGYSPDHLRMSIDAVGLVRNAFNQGKPVAAICHAGWMLVEADIADGRTLTSWPSIKTDLLNAGARWVDREVVEDGNLITSRKPDDLGAFSDALLRQIERGAPEFLEPVVAPEAAAQEPAGDGAKRTAA
jgi:protease I